MAEFRRYDAMRRWILAVTAVGGVAAGAQAQLWEVGNRLLLPTDGDQASSEFGAALAAGDFNGDGLGDLAVGSPYRDVPELGLEAAGMVEIFFGGADRRFVSSVRIVGSSDDAKFGGALVAGDFDGDGDDELAVGVTGFLIASGEVQIYDYEGAEWHSPARFHQGENGLPGAAEAEDEFGRVLAVGDFDHDGRDDLAVGIPLEDVSGSDEGAVEVLYGSAIGLAGAGSQIFVAGQGGVLGTRGNSDRFGFALATGDFDVDGFADLAIGAPLRDVASATDSGQVHILLGGAAGLSATGDLLLDTVAVDDDAAGAHFGFALAAGDFNYPGLATCIAVGGCAPDLAVGSPNHEADTAQQAGRVTILFAHPGTGLTITGAQVLDQADSVDEQPEAFDDFGLVLAAGQLDGGGLQFGPRRSSDLVVGVPFEATTAGFSVGVAHLFLGGASGPGAPGSQDLRARAGLATAPAQSQDKFGAALAIADFNGDGRNDLALALSRRERPGASAAGAVQVLFGGLFADGLEAELLCGWTTAGCP